MTAQPEEILSQALAYASRGWPVLPCRPGSKEPATRHGLLDASTEPGQIRRWWDRHPDANLAIATGRPGPDILDVDQHGQAGNGFAACRRLREAGLLTGARAIIATPSGGLHAYFAGTSQPSARLPRLHIDFKARGGYVLAPPSAINGTHYQVIARQPAAGTLDWAAVTSLLQPEPRQQTWLSRPAPADITRLAAWVERLTRGNRNSGLFWAACRAAETGYPEHLAHLAAAAATTGLPEREIHRTMTSATRAVQRHQRERQAEAEAGA